LPNELVATPRVRVLQIVESLDNQAVESWLLRTFRRAAIDFPNFEWTFFCVLPTPGQFDRLVMESGGRVIHSRFPIHNKISFLRSLRQVMRDGAFDVLHCHHDIMSGAYILASLGLPIRKRIVHLHNTAVALPTNNPLKKFLFYAPMRQLCLHMADRVVGISNEALGSITGDRRKKGRDVVVHYGVDTKSFAIREIGGIDIRRELRLDAETKILLFVGRMVDYKNPLFVLKVLRCLLGGPKKFVAVFVGKGPLESEVMRAAGVEGLSERVRVLGFRSEVPDFMHAADVCIWPSLESPKEGLGLGVIEAQAAGLPILMSQSVPTEAIVIPELVSILPLAAGPEAWAAKVNLICETPRPSKAEALAQVERSSYSMGDGVANIMALYV
jgi:glycosyltransferase EpsF